MKAKNSQRNCLQLALFMATLNVDVTGHFQTDRKIKRASENKKDIVRYGDTVL